MLQPFLARLLVGGDHLFDDFVDIVGGAFDHAQRRCAFHMVAARVLQQIFHTAAQEARLAHAIRTDERGRRDVALSEPARIFDGGGRSVDPGRFESVAQDVEHRVDVLLDARFEHTRYAVVIAQRGDRLEDEPLNVFR